MPALNARERVSLAFLGMLLLAGLGATLLQRRHLQGRQQEPVPAAEQAEWNQRLASAREVDVNAATSAELERLPGIGPTLANRIVEDRNQHGPFSSVGDIRRVSGIGEKKYESIRRRLTVKQ